MNALAMSLAAVPVYLLCRRIGLGAEFGLGAAAAAVAAPDLLFANFVLADRSHTRSS
jgi:asparagine N-glycosylation enzyme membrane subunit Stt3